MKDLTGDIRRAGERAVKMYATMIGSALAREQQEDGTPERFISSAMAIYLRREKGINVCVERDYEKLARQLRLRLGKRARTRLQNLRADIAVYDGGKPAAIIEVKKLAYFDVHKSVLGDLRKGDPGMLGRRLDVYAAIFVCETGKRDLRDQMERLEQKTGLRFEPPKGVWSKSRKWRWGFAMTRVVRGT